MLGAGFALAVAGCGPPEETKVVPSQVWGESLSRAEDVVGTYEGVAGTEDLARRAKARVKSLQAAYDAAGGAPRTPGKALADPGLETALAAERSELQAHVAAVGLLGDRPSRELLASLIADGAQSETALLMKLDRQPVAQDFVGQPPR